MMGPSLISSEPIQRDSFADIHARVGGRLFAESGSIWPEHRHGVAPLSNEFQLRVAILTAAASQKCHDLLKLADR